jgi:hypothetical protein
MVHVTKIIMSKLYLDEYSEKTNFTKTQKSIEAISDHLRMVFLKQKYVFSNKLKPLASTKEIKSFEMTEKDNQKKMSTNAEYRRLFPSLKTKVTFPLFVPYMLIKLVYIGIVAFNFFFLSKIFQFNYLEYGVYMLKNYFNRSNSSFYSLNQNDYFPKNSMCDTHIMSKHDYIHHSVVCALPINLFNEIFYFIYWYWLVFLLISTVMSVFNWLLLSIKSYRRRLVMNALQLDPSQNISRSYMAAYYLGEETTYQVADAFLLEKTGMSLKENFDLFFEDVCNTDIIFTLKMLSLNSNQLAMRDIMNNLWYHYLNLEDVVPREVKQRPLLPLKRPEKPVSEEKKPDDQFNVEV